jgi:hypothetical protein
MWKRESDLAERVANAWAEAGTKSDLGDIMRGLDNIMSALQGWSKKKFGNVVKEFQKAREQLELLILNNADQKSIR